MLRIHITQEKVLILVQMMGTYRLETGAWKPADIYRSNNKNFLRSGLVGFLTLSIVRFSKEHNVSETGSVSVLRWGVGRHQLCGLLVQWLRLALSHGSNRVGDSHPSPEDGNRFSLRNVGLFCVFLEYPTMDKVQKPQNPECYIPSSEPP
jgi:hypothetical protein